AMAFTAPRSLNEPIGCRFSSLSQISAGASSRLSRTSGVSTAAPAMRSRAARIASRPGTSGACKLLASERNRDSGAGGERGTVDVVRGGEVLDRDPQRLEQRDVLVGEPAGRAVQQHVPELALDVLVTERSLGAADQEVA